MTQRKEISCQKKECKEVAACLSFKRIHSKLSFLLIALNLSFLNKL